MPFANRVLSALSIALVLSASACSHAADESARPPVLDTLEGHGVVVLGEFDAPEGLRAFAAMSGTQPVAVYVAADGSAIVGTRLDADGQQADATALREQALKPLGKRIWAQLDAATWIRDGHADAPRVVYTFSDPNCPFCNRLWHAARPWVDAGRVQLRHVMVGIIREDSEAKAAAMLAAPDPGATLADNERNFAKGGIKPAATVPPAIGADLQRNQILMLELGFQGTPALVYRDGDGIVQRSSGLPRDEAGLTAVFGPRP